MGALWPPGRHPQACSFPRAAPTSVLANDREARVTEPALEERKHGLCKVLSLRVSHKYRHDLYYDGFSSPSADRIDLLVVMCHDYLRTLAELFGACASLVLTSMVPLATVHDTPPVIALGPKNGGAGRRGEGGYTASPNGT